MSLGNFTMKEALQFEPDLTINEIVAPYQETIPVFNEVGVDTCRGGGA